MFKRNKPLKRWHVIVLLLIVGAAMLYRFYTHVVSPRLLLVWPKAQVVIGNQTLDVVVAHTYERRFRGWSHRKYMDPYDGMLFAFPQAGRPGIVMREMEFPLDIIWINNGAIVDIAPNAPPEQGRAEQDLTVYLPSRTSTMVLEVPAGFMQRTGIKIGDRIEVR